MCVPARERGFVLSPVVSSPMFVVRVIPAAGGGPPPTRSLIFSVFAEMKHAHPRQNGP